MKPNRLTSRLWLNGNSIPGTLSSTLASMNLTDFFDILLDDEDDLYRAGSTSDRQCHLVLMTVEHEVKTGGTDGEVPQFDSFKERRQRWTHKLQKASSPIDLQSKASLQCLKPGTGCPSLWSTGHRIACGTFTRTTMEPTKELRHSMEIKKETGVEESGKNPHGPFFISIGRHAGGNDRIVVRPHRPVMVGHRVIPSF